MFGDHGFGFHFVFNSPSAWHGLCGPLCYFYKTQIRATIIGCLIYIDPSPLPPLIAQSASALAWQLRRHHEAACTIRCTAHSLRNQLDRAVQLCRWYHSILHEVHPDDDPAIAIYGSFHKLRGVEHSGKNKTVEGYSKQTWFNWLKIVCEQWNILLICTRKPCGLTSNPNTH